jgi:hypothetical protein
MALMGGGAGRGPASITTVQKPCRPGRPVAGIEGHGGSPQADSHQVSLTSSARPGGIRSMVLRGGVRGRMGRRSLLGLRPSGLGTKEEREKKNSRPTDYGVEQNPATICQPEPEQGGRFWSLSYHHQPCRLQIPVWSVSLSSYPLIGLLLPRPPTGRRARASLHHRLGDDRSYLSLHEDAATGKPQNSPRFRMMRHARRD